MREKHRDPSNQTPLAVVNNPAYLMGPEPRERRGPESRHLSFPRCRRHLIAPPKRGARIAGGCCGGSTAALTRGGTGLASSNERIA